jgi:hypothetical protein
LRVPKAGTVTDLLQAWSHGDQRAHARLVSLVYKELLGRLRRVTWPVTGAHG